MIERGRPMTPQEVEELLRGSKLPPVQKSAPAASIDSGQFADLWRGFSPAPQAPRPLPNRTPRSPVPEHPPRKQIAAPPAHPASLPKPVDAILASSPLSRNSLRNTLWNERGRTYKVVAGLSSAALAAIVGAGFVHAKTGESVATIVADATGLSADSGGMTFESFDCNKPAVAVQVEKHDEYILNYKGIIPNAAELEKSKKDDSYEPIRIDSFDDIEGAKKAQSATKPAAVEPFVDTGATDRLPQTVFSGAVNLGICSTDSMSKVIKVNGSKVTVDGSLLAFSYDPLDSTNKKAVVAYEKFAPEAPKDNPGYISDEEFNRIRDIVVPDEKNPALNNEKFDALIVSSTLKALGSTACSDPLQSAGKAYIEWYIKAKYPNKTFDISWGTGAIGSPQTAYVLNNPTEPDVQQLNIDTTCENIHVLNEGEK